MIELPRRSRPNVNADINIVPYIDVMLVLLVIFMMTTPIIEQGMEVDLPQGPATMLDYSDGQQPTVITVDSENRYYINSWADEGIQDIGDSEPVSLKVIVNQVIGRKNKFPDMAVVLKGDKSSAYGTLFRLMSELKSRGVDKVSFSSENPN
jgi:biopolymer transport protein TolR